MTIASLSNCQQASASFTETGHAVGRGLMPDTGLFDRQAAFCSDAELNLGTRAQSKRRPSLRKSHDLHVERAGRLSWHSADFHASQAI